MIVATTGKFDVLHSGHFAILNHIVSFAVETKSVLLIMIDSDARIIKTTGQRPVFTAGERTDQVREVIRGIAQDAMFSTYVFDYDEELIDLYASHRQREKILLIKGSEWNGKPIIGKEHVDLYFFDTGKNKMSSTFIKERIKQWWDEQT